MAYTRTTLTQLKAKLLERVGGGGNFWTEFEFEAAINEALAVWQLLVGEFSVEGKISTTNLPQEFVKLYDPAGTAVSIEVTNGTTANVLPLSVWRIGTDVTAHTTGSLYTFNKLVQQSLPDLDHAYSGWRTGSASTAEYWVPQGVADVVFSPRPNTPVKLDYYKGSRLLDAASDYVQLGDEELNRILDYAVWQLNFKSGTQEAFQNTGPLKEMFILAATLRNAKLRASKLYKDFLGSDYGEAEPSREADTQKGGR